MLHMRTVAYCAAGLLVAAGLFAGSARTGLAAYPEKPVTVLVGFAAGGGTDQVARFLSGMVEKDLKQPFVISNIPGASGGRSLAEIARARPDGYTVLFMTSNLSTLKATGHSPHTYKGQYGDNKFTDKYT